MKNEATGPIMFCGVNGNLPTCAMCVNCKLFDIVNNTCPNVGYSFKNPINCICIYWEDGHNFQNKEDQC